MTERGDDSFEVATVQFNISDDENMNFTFVNKTLAPWFLLVNQSAVNWLTNE